MKRFLRHPAHISLFFFATFLAVVPILSFGQICSTPYILNFDGRDHAFIAGPNQGIVNWVQPIGSPSIWNLCRGGGNNPPNAITINPLPTPNPNNNTNRIYIEIQAGTHVFVNSISLQNNVTLVICGSLTLGTLTLADGDLGELNNVRIVVCPGGSFTLDVLQAKNNVTLSIDGLLTVNSIEGQASNLCITSSNPSAQGFIMNQAGYPPFISDNWRYGTSPSSCTSTSPSAGGVILPIELLSFVAQARPDRIDLRWTTGTEINNDYFTIERSRDLYGWEVLGHVQGAGNSSIPLSYSFNDIRPLDGVAYYRLKQTDFDGKFEYFRPVAVHYDLGMKGLEFKVVKQHSHWIIAVPNDGVYQVEVYNLIGHRLASHQVENNVAIPAPEGAVVIRVTDGFARTTSRVVM